MSGECSNCESRQRRGNDPRCLICIYFNPAIFNKGFTKEVSEVHESDKGNFYFTFPCSTRLRNKYVRIYGTDISTRAAIEKMYPNTDYIQYDSVEWNTPNKYTRRKPCDCYTEWI
jgi:hypothetical protein